MKSYQKCRATSVVGWGLPYASRHRRAWQTEALSLSRLAPSKRSDQRDYIFLPPRIILYFTVKLTVKLCVRIPIVPVNFRVNVP